MTRHLHDEAAAKLHVSLEDADVLLAKKMNLLESEGLGVCGVGVKSLRGVAAKPALVKVEADVKACTLKSKLGTAVRDLFDLDGDGASEKPLNVDLGVDLYQMENY
ncbi:MAG: hypothetical protein NWF05_07375 [Candidatus Bathyarchaeota archaeon]|nr:hypothetical protein [Candidatus Bathyarchaeota archaeon]